MRICLVRHGIAEDPGAYATDAERPLTERGRERMEAAAQGLATLVRPDLILSSPLLRARQTAEIIAAVTGTAVEECEALATGDHSTLLTAARHDSTVAVGHEPHISNFLAWALGTRHLPVEIKKGSAAMVHFPGAAGPGAGTLDWFMPPRALRELRKAPAG